MANRVVISLECSVCKDRNYATTKNKKGKAGSDKLVLKKFCRRCRKHTEHKESK